MRLKIKFMNLKNPVIPENLLISLSVLPDSKQKIILQLYQMSLQIFSRYSYGLLQFIRLIYY